MRGYLVTTEFEVGQTPWHFLVPEGTIYVPEVKIKVYQWKDRDFFGLVGRLSQQEFKDARTFHSRNLKEVELDRAVVRELATYFSQIEPLIPAMKEIWKLSTRLPRK